jgi:hypothetical protein
VENYDKVDTYFQTYEGIRFLEEETERSSKRDLK